MDIRKIKKLIEMLEASGIAELEITEGEESVRISRYGQTPPMPAMPYPPQAYNLAPPPAAANPSASTPTSATSRKASSAASARPATNWH